jgi:hypothetical protein
MYNKDHKKVIAYFIYPIIEPGTGTLHGQYGLGPIFILPISVRLKWLPLKNHCG